MRFPGFPLRSSSATPAWRCDRTLPVRAAYAYGGVTDPSVWD
ncbi:hypothetical protein [Azospirillum doebereinerae]